MRKTTKFRSLNQIADLLDALFYAMARYDDQSDDHDYQDDLELIQKMCDKTNDKLYPLFKEFNELAERKPEN